MDDKTFYEFELDGQKIAFHKDAVIEVQTGRGKSAYKTLYSFTAEDFRRLAQKYDLKFPT